MPNRIKNIDSLRVLVIEDNLSDAEMVKRQLRKSEYNCEVLHCDTLEDFQAELEVKIPDIILSDYNLIEFTGLDVLEIAIKKCPLVPFIIVTGTLDEETAVETIKAGAWDYVLKDHLLRLNAAINSALVLQLEKQEKIRAVDELRRSQERFELAVKGTLDGIWDWDFENKEFYFSTRCKAIIGYGDSEFKNDLEEFKYHIHPDDEKKANLELSKHLDGNTSHYQDRFRLKCKDGSYKWVLMRGLASFNKAGQAYRMAGSLSDLSKIQKNELELKKLSSAVYHAPLSVVITDPKGNIEYVNPKFTVVSGYTLEEVKGKNTNVLNSGRHSKEFFQNLWWTIERGQDWYGELCNKNKFGELFWESVSISPIKSESGQIVNYVAIKEDITLRKKTESELMLAKVKAEESERVKSAFFANISHEIRTPMNSIVGFSEFLTMDDVDDQSKKEYSKIIQSSTNLLLRMISDILDLSKIEAGVIDLVWSEMDVDTMLAEVLSSFLNSVRDIKKIDVDCRIKPLGRDQILVCDIDRLKQIFFSFLNNAYNYTSQGYVELGCDLQEDIIEFYVKDTGIGIVEEKQKVIFESFRQVDESLSKMNRGVGLGLTIASQLISLLGGKLKLESKESEGSKFFFSIPLKQSSPK